jgi:hypothetical protein
MRNEASSAERRPGNNRLICHETSGLLEEHRVCKWQGLGEFDYFCDFSLQRGMGGSGESGPQVHSIKITASCHGQLRGEKENPSIGATRFPSWSIPVYVRSGDRK